MPGTVFLILEVKMIRKQVITLLVLAALSSGCTLKTNGVKIKSPGIEVELNSGSGHCPPGQAKKGNC